MTAQRTTLERLQAYRDRANASYARAMRVATNVNIRANALHAERFDGLTGTLRPGHTEAGRAAFSRAIRAAKAHEALADIAMNRASVRLARTEDRPKRSRRARPQARANRYSPSLH